MRTGSWNGPPLSASQIESLWISAGGPSSIAPTMARIVSLESSGYPDAYNPTDNGGTQTSWGLWQISDGTHNEPANWDDPGTNARMAVAKYHSQGLGAWGTYTPANFPGGTVPAAPPISGANTSILTQVLQSSTNPFTLFDNWARNSQVNVLYKAFALVFVLIVLAMIPRTSKFAGWIALAILFILLIQKSPQG